MRAVMVTGEECSRLVAFRQATGEVRIPVRRRLSPVGDLGTAAKRVLWPFRTALNPQAIWRQDGFENEAAWYEYTRYYAPTDAHAADHRLRLRRHPQPLRPRPRRQGLQADRAHHQAARPTATEDDHLALLAYLNSSTACFWMKQVRIRRPAPRATSAPKRRAKPEGESLRVRRDRNAAVAHSRSLPSERHARKIRHARASSLAMFGPHRKRQAVTGPGDSSTARDAAKTLSEHVALRTGTSRDLELPEAVRSMQEEIDWLVYEALRSGSTEAMPHRPDDRPVGPPPFRGVGSRQADARALRTNRRLADLHARQRPGAMERRRRVRVRSKRAGARVATVCEPELRPQWREVAVEQRPGELASASVDASSASWRRQLVARSSAVLARCASACSRLGGTSRLAIARVDIASDRGDLVDRESIPFLAAQRFTEAGLEKHAAWQQTWDLQRREDAGEKVGEIPVPPKYDQKDFRDATAWRLRGKLDVPKERFISYPGCESASRPLPRPRLGRLGPPPAGPGAGRPVPGAQGRRGLDHRAPDADARRAARAAAVGQAVAQRAVGRVRRPANGRVLRAVPRRGVPRPGPDARRPARLATCEEDPGGSSKRKQSRWSRRPTMATAARRPAPRGGRQEEGRSRPSLLSR